MSYSEENNEVVLRMSREDYERILLAFGAQSGVWLSNGEEIGPLLETLNRLNSGNPNYTPYQTGKVTDHGD